ncbi:MAG: lipase family protein [Pseudomonadota bacterium]
MDVFEQIGRNYDWYPNTAIALCAISYDDMGAIPGEVENQTGLKVVWGPAELDHWDDVSYSRAFIAGDSETNEYFVVIRGTNFESLSSWLNQDFDLDKAKPFGQLPGSPPKVPADALISQGTFNGMSDLIRLRDPATHASMVEFLSALKPQYLYVTGHSLGGTLTPTLFAYLNAMLNGGGPAHGMALWSFAGLTPGGTGFNAYFNSVLINDQGFEWRIHNSLDIAPFCWCAFPDLRQVYAPYGLHWDFAEKDLIADLFHDAAKAGIGYAHPQAGLQLPGHFERGLIDANIWAAQALFQHHPSTYQRLVVERYPGLG